MDSLAILLQNAEFVGSVYNLTILMWLVIALVVIDLALKGWAMWRAAKLDRKIWFVMLLLTHSMGILPLIFLGLTKKRYKALMENGENPL